MVISLWKLEVQMAVFSKWNMLREWNLYKDLLFVYLQPSVNKNNNLVILTLHFDDVTAKTIYNYKRKG